MTHPVLNVGELVRLNMVLDAAGRNAKVIRFYEAGAMVVEGTARHVVRNGDFHFAKQDDDVRDMFLRVTLDNGFDVIWPIQELADGIANGTYVPDASGSYTWPS